MPWVLIKDLETIFYILIILVSLHDTSYQNMKLTISVKLQDWSLMTYIQTGRIKGFLSENQG